MRNYGGYRWKDVLNEYCSQTFFFMSMMKREQDEIESGQNKSKTGEFIGG